MYYYVDFRGFLPSIALEQQLDDACQLFSEKVSAIVYLLQNASTQRVLLRMRTPHWASPRVQVCL